MPIPKHMIGIKGDECSCGRRKSIRHCPVCGSARTYGYAVPQWHQVLGAEHPKQVKLFRCMSCAHRFCDEEREFCEAPPISPVLMRAKIQAIHDAAKHGEVLTDSDARIAKSLAALTKTEGSSVVGEAQPETEEQKKAAFLQLKWDLRREHADKLLQHKLGKGEHPGEVESYIEARLKELNVQTEVK